MLNYQHPLISFNGGARRIEEVLRKALGWFMARAARREDMKKLDDSIRSSSEKGVE